MPATKTDIFHKLQQDILHVQGCKPSPEGGVLDVELGPMITAFPNNTFPLAAVHEFICPGLEDAAATGGFIAGLVGALMRSGGACIWIGAARTLFPHALKSFGIEPDRIIFVDLQTERDVLWTMEEALKCSGLAAVVGELQEIPFIASRRLQLAVEQSRVTGFILRHHPRNGSATACVSRWKISPLPSVLEDGLPGLGFPRWNVELEKARNGKPGTWHMEWTEKGFRNISRKLASMPMEQKTKTG